MQLETENSDQLTEMPDGIESFLQLRVPPKVVNEAAILTECHVLPLTRSTKRIQLVLVDSDPNALAKLTWGMSGVNLENTVIEIFVAGLMDPENWQGEIRSSSRLRCGWIHHLILSERATIKRFELGSSIQNLVVFWDRDDVSIQFQSKHHSTTDEELILHEGRFEWTFGNPSRELKERLRKMEQSAESPETRSLLLDCLSGCPPIEPPFEEVFEDSNLDAQLVPGFDLRNYQEEAINNWVENDYRGVFAMCTGSGKTVTSFGAAVTLCRALSAGGEPMPFIVVTVPKRILADQWVDEIEEIFGQSALRAYGTAARWQGRIRAYTDIVPEDFPRFIVTTYATFGADKFLEAIEHAAQAGRKAMLIADEAHNISSSRLRDALSRCAGVFDWRLALSATPMVEHNDTANRFNLEYFSEASENLEATEEQERFCGSYTLADGIRDTVLCRYNYYPLPMFLDPDTGAEYLRILQEIDDDQSDIGLYTQRREIIQKSNLPMLALESLLRRKQQNLEPLDHTLVYCQPGSVKEKQEDDDSDVEPVVRNLLAETTRIIDENGLETKVIIGQTSETDRKKFLAEFRSGKVDCLCAIGCLDEGVDIPSIERALVLYSIDRERQFVQRRGRILRKDRDNPDKTAEIYDVILLPHASLLSSSQAQSLLAKEMRRYREFAILADNRSEAESVISQALTATH